MRGEKAVNILTQMTHPVVAQTNNGGAARMPTTDHQLLARCDVNPGKFAYALLKVPEARPWLLTSTYFGWVSTLEPDSFGVIASYTKLE